jgi:hypothetical protein
MKLRSHKVNRRIVTCLAMGTVMTAAILGTMVGCAGDGGGLISGGGGEDFLSTGRTASFFTALQVDPRSEDSAGPQFVVAADLNDDGLLDLVSAWNQSQPVQVHLQQRTQAGVIRFETLNLAGNIPSVSVAGLTVADFDLDGAPDVAVLMKESLLEGAGCLDSEQPNQGLNGVIVLYLGPPDPTQTNQSLAWEEVQIGASFLQGLGESGGAPEEGGFTSLAVGDMDNDDDQDLVVAWNSSCGAGVHDVVVFTNNGRGAVRDGSWTGVRVPDAFPKGTAVKDVALADVDLDADLDIVATYPDAPTMNVRWYRNPQLDLPDDYHVSAGDWQVGLVGQLATGADGVRIGDIDGDGRADVVARSTAGKLIQWFRNPAAGATTAPLRSIPWQVYTLAEFSERVPWAISLGDLNDDGRLDLAAAAGGGIVWFSSPAANRVFDQWIERLIIDDEPPGSPNPGPATTDPSVSPEEIAGGTFINSLVVADLDNDGRNDLITTLDRSGLSGITNDALVWLRSTLGN